VTDSDIRFYFDLCPFAWITSRWVRMVAAQRDYAVEWRFISLRMINSGIDYDSHFPAGYATTFGKPVAPDRMTRLFRALVAGSGLPPVTLHGLRHGVATLAQRRGVASDATFRRSREETTP
jgi:integrase